MASGTFYDAWGPTATATDSSNRYHQNHLKVTWSSDNEKVIYTINAYARSGNGSGYYYMSDYGVTVTLYYSLNGGSWVSLGSAFGTLNYNDNVANITKTLTINRTHSSQTIKFAADNTGNSLNSVSHQTSNDTINVKPSYTVSYNANNGSNAPADQTKWYNETLTLSSTKPIRTNYIFKGWGTSSTSTTVAYSSGAAYTVNDNLTLYAIWQLEEEIEFKTLSALANGTGLGIGKKAITSNLLDINFNTQINKNFSQRNATNVQLDNETKQAWRTALAPKILFSGDSNGTITLSESAANYSHMRIYYRVYNDANGYRSVKIFEPDGKNVNLFAGETGQDNGYFWPAGRDITINGTSITTRATNRYYAASSVSASSRTTAKTNYVYITCVEVW